MDYLHCNHCFILPSKEVEYSMTNCGHIYCQKCHPQIVKNGFCTKCKMKTRMVKINATLKPDYLIFFKDISATMNRIIKVMNFHRVQAKNLIDHLNQENQRLQRLINASKKTIDFLTKELSSRPQIKNENSYKNKDIPLNFTIKEEPFDDFLENDSNLKLDYNLNMIEYSSFKHLENQNQKTYIKSNRLPFNSINENNSINMLNQMKDTQFELNETYDSKQDFSTWMPRRNFQEEESIGSFYVPKVDNFPIPSKSSALSKVIQSANGTVVSSQIINDSYIEALRRHAM